MQRQSLGSPAGKRLSPAASGADGDGDDRKKKRRTKTRVPEVEEAAGEQHEVIPDRPVVRRSSVGTTAATERSVHLIPLLTLLCFFILYLCSHDPSTEDVADLGGADRLFDHAASTTTDIERFAAAGGVSAAAHGHRSLKELERLRGHRRRSRKLGRSPL